MNKDLLKYSVNNANADQLAVVPVEQLRLIHNMVSQLDNQVNVLKASLEVFGVSGYSFETTVKTVADIPYMWEKEGDK